MKNEYIYTITLERDFEEYEVLATNNKEEVEEAYTALVMQYQPSYIKVRLYCKGHVLYQNRL